INQPRYQSLFKLHESRANVALLLAKLDGQIRETLFDARAPGRSRLRFWRLRPGRAAIDGAPHGFPADTAPRKLGVGAGPPRRFISDHSRARVESHSINVSPMIVVIRESLMTDGRRVERIARRPCVGETADNIQVNFQRVRHQLMLLSLLP